LKIQLTMGIAMEKRDAGSFPSFSFSFLFFSQIKLAFFGQKKRELFFFFEFKKGTNQLSFIIDLSP